MASALIAVVVSIADDLSDPAFFVLLAADLLIISSMGALIGGMRVQAAEEAARLDALEPLRAGAHGDRR
ncbi:hypothetical protein ACFQ2B_06340 [Streptomyces stramineus]